MLARRGFWAGLAMVVVAGSAVVVSQASAEQTLDLKKWYVLVNRGSGKVLDDRGFATNDGAAVVQWARHGGANQQWRFIDAGDGYYRLQNRNSGKVLDDLGWSKTAGSAIVQWKDLNGINQQFKLAKSSDGHVRLVNRFSGMAVGVRKSAKADGGVVVQDRDRGGAAQQWQLVPAGSAGTQPSSPPPGHTGATTRFMGSSRVLIGGSMTDASAAAAPFDMRYAYVHSQPAPSSAYYSAARAARTGGRTGGAAGTAAPRRLARM
ncbi:RICIN domain-containing protein [Streptomyces achromogenes]|uniref:RICIN domain-containing protein n=1 Tax=Streptomyces achromogenes TaxID=67255 RepID=UPI00371F3964